MNMPTLAKYANYAKSRIAKATQSGVRLFQDPAVDKRNAVGDANVSTTLTQMNEWTEVENTGQSMSTQNKIAGASEAAIRITKRTHYVEGKVLRTINEEDENDSNSEFMKSSDD